MDNALSVVNNEAKNRFETDLDGHTAFLNYKQRGGSLILVHTEVPAEVGGRGAGAALVRTALEYARANALKVVPLCPFVKSYMERHPENSGH